MIIKKPNREQEHLQKMRDLRAQELENAVLELAELLAEQEDALVELAEIME